jgi:hypothetical protein
MLNIRQTAKQDVVHYNVNVKQQGKGRNPKRRRERKKKGGKKEMSTSRS